MTSASTAPTPESSQRLRLFGLSFLMLFVELALIRWTGSNLLYLSYFSNFVLLGSFLGIGLGFLLVHSRHDLFRFAPLTLALLIAFVTVSPVEINRSGSQLIYFGSARASGLPIWIVLPFIFLAVAAVLATIAQQVARVFEKFESLDAYRLDITGSIAGIVVFSVLSFLGAPPIAWGIIVAALLVGLMGQRLRGVGWLWLAFPVLLLGIESFASGASWSPYYKIETGKATIENNNVVGVFVNGIPHQNIESIEARKQLEPIYFHVYDRIPAASVKDVLIIGAGNGIDIAAALQRGARYVDAVEIDPKIAELGKQLNPDRPYADPRVHLHINDGRAFLEQTDRKYDLVIFALPDSLTLVSGQSSLRLESFLFTREALTSALDHVRPDGAFTMYNYYREPWLVARLSRTLEQVTGHVPCIDTLGAGALAILTASPTPGTVQCPDNATALTRDGPEPATDDHPFLYLHDRAIPGFYLLTILLILIASVFLVRAAAPGFRGMAQYVDLFFMGAAFLLLETKNVVQFALLFGTTWFVNALVFTGVLLAVLLAIEVARRVTIKRLAPLYTLLFASLGLAWLIPPSALLALNAVPRFFAATVLAFVPVFVANLVFSARFKDVASSTTAFGANLLGAMVGGLIEYAALVVGYRALLIVASALYALAFVAVRRRETSSLSLARRA